jgi:8-oxo-dGTP diphosphatase
VLIKRQGGHKVFAGIRKGSHGAGTLALPGGHLEFGESWEETAIREVEEECGIKLSSGLKLVHVTNDPMPDENKHYVTLFMGASCNEDAKLVNAEPHKCEGWEEFTLEELSEQSLRLFGPLLHMIEDMPESVTNWLAEKNNS